MADVPDIMIIPMEAAAYRYHENTRIISFPRCLFKTTQSLTRSSVARFGSDRFALPPARPHALPHSLAPCFGPAFASPLSACCARRSLGVARAAASPDESPSRTDGIVLEDRDAPRGPRGSLSYAMTILCRVAAVLGAMIGAGAAMFVVAVVTLLLRDRLWR